MKMSLLFPNPGTWWFLLRTWFKGYHGRNIIFVCRKNFHSSRQVDFHADWCPPRRNVLHTVQRCRRTLILNPVGSNSDTCMSLRRYPINMTNYTSNNSIIDWYSKLLSLITIISNTFTCISYISGPMYFVHLGTIFWSSHIHIKFSQILQ